MAEGDGGGQAEEEMAEDIIWAGGGWGGGGGYEGTFRWAKQGLCLMRTAAALATRTLARLRGGGGGARAERLSLGGFFDCS